MMSLIFGKIRRKHGFQNKEERELNINLEIIMQYVTIGLTVLGIIAAFVSLITEVIKELPKLKKIPTSLVALIVSLLLCVMILIAVCQILDYILYWYMVAGSIVFAFLVYIIATGGWDRVKSIWDRTKYKNS